MSIPAERFCAVNLSTLYHYVNISLFPFSWTVFFFQVFQNHSVKKKKKLFHKTTKTSSCEFKSAYKCCGCVPVGAGNPQCKVAIVMCRSISQDVKSRSVACKQIFDTVVLNAQYMFVFSSDQWPKERSGF